MRKRLVPGVALFCLALLPALARPAEKQENDRPAKPTLVVRVAALDRLAANLNYLATLAGQEEQAKQFEKLLQSKTGDKGLEGIDTKRPIGLYAHLGKKVEDSRAVLMVPVADEKTFLDTLDRLNYKPTKDKDDDGLYTVEVEKVPFPVHFRFADRYAYAALRDKVALAKDALLTPAAVLPAGEVGDLSVVVNVDQVPAPYKQMVIGQSALRLAALKDKEKPGETEAQKDFRVAVLDDVGARIKSLVNEGGELRLRFDVDRKAGDVALALDLSAKPGSPMARNIADLGQARSVAAALVADDSAWNVVVQATLPANLRKALEPAIDEGVKKALEKEGDEEKRKLLSGLLEALTPTLKAGTLDAGFDLRGPGDDGLYTLVVGARVKDGASLDKAMRDVVKKLPEDKSANIKLDFAKAGDVAIHRLVPEKVDEQNKELFGNKPFFIAFRDDAVLMSAGAKGLEALKEAVAAAPKAGKTLRVEMSLARLAKLMARQQKSAPEVAREVFGKERNGDKVSIILEGGKALELRLSMKAQALKFFALVQKKEKEARER